MKTKIREYYVNERKIGGGKWYAIDQYETVDDANASLMRMKEIANKHDLDTKFRTFHIEEIKTFIG